MVRLARRIENFMLSSRHESLPVDMNSLIGKVLQQNTRGRARGVRKNNCRLCAPDLARFTARERQLTHGLQFRDSCLRLGGRTLNLARHKYKSPREPFTFKHVKPAVIIIMWGNKMGRGALLAYRCANSDYYSACLILALSASWRGNECPLLSMGGVRGVRLDPDAHQGVWIKMRGYLTKRCARQKAVTDDGCHNRRP